MPPVTLNRNNRNRRGGSRVTRFAKAFTVKKLTAILFILATQLSSSAAVKIGNGTVKQNAFRNKLAVSLRNEGFNGFHKTFAMATAAALVPGPDQEQMMALVCPPKIVGTVGTFGKTPIYEAVPYATCLQTIADVAELQTKLLSKTQTYISASLMSQEEKVKKEVASQLALKNVEISGKYDKAVEERVRAGLAEAQQTQINLRKQLNKAKQNRESANLSHKTNLNKAQAESRAARAAFDAAQKRDQKMREKLWGLAGGFVDVLATPGAIFTSLNSFMSVFMILVVVLAGFAGMSTVLFFVPGSSKLFGLLFGVLRKANVNDDVGLKKVCAELKAEMKKEKDVLEVKIKELTAERNAVVANLTMKLGNIENLKREKNNLSRQLANARRNSESGANKNRIINNLRRQIKNLNNRLGNLRTAASSAVVVRAVNNPTVRNVNAALRRANSPRAANAVVAAIADPTQPNVNRAVRAVGAQPPPPPPPPPPPQAAPRSNTPRPAKNTRSIAEQALNMRKRLKKASANGPATARTATPQPPNLLTQLKGNGAKKGLKSSNQQAPLKNKPTNNNRPAPMLASLLATLERRRGAMNGNRNGKKEGNGSNNNN